VVCMRIVEESLLEDAEKDEREKGVLILNVTRVRNHGLWN